MGPVGNLRGGNVGGTIAVGAEIAKEEVEGPGDARPPASAGKSAAEDAGETDLLPRRGAMDALLSHLAFDLGGALTTSIEERAESNEVPVLDNVAGGDGGFSG